jgi:hypothetical protein
MGREQSRDVGDECLVADEDGDGAFLGLKVEGRAHVRGKQKLEGVVGGEVEHGQAVPMLFEKDGAGDRLEHLHLAVGHDGQCQRVQCRAGARGEDGNGEESPGGTGLG